MSFSSFLSSPALSAMCAEMADHSFAECEHAGG